MDIAILIVRIILGLYIAAHGTQKLFGWFGGPGLANAGGFFEQLSYRPGRLFALVASLGELVGGLLTFLGLFGALGPAIIILVMIVAIFSAHVTKGFFTQNGGFELNLFYIAAALAVAFGGNGSYSLDRVFGLTFLTDPHRIWIALGIAVILAILNLLVRRPAKQAST